MSEYVHSFVKDDEFHQDVAGLSYAQIFMKERWVLGNSDGRSVLTSERPLAEFDMRTLATIACKIKADVIIGPDIKIEVVDAFYRNLVFLTIHPKLLDQPTDTEQPTPDPRTFIIHYDDEEFQDALTTFDLSQLDSDGVEHGIDRGILTIHREGPTGENTLTSFEPFYYALLACKARVSIIQLCDGRVYVSANEAMTHTEIEVTLCPGLTPHSSPLRKLAGRYRPYLHASPNDAPTGATTTEEHPMSTPDLSKHSDHPITLIAAMNYRRVIGDGQTLLWCDREDLRHFKEQTEGHIVVMGRKTYESLSDGGLPNRYNVVITRNPMAFTEQFTVRAAEGVIEALTLATAMAADLTARFGKEHKVFCIGGGEIYRQALDFATTIQLTMIPNDITGEVTFPVFESDPAWRLTGQEVGDTKQDGSANVYTVWQRVAYPDLNRE